MNLQNKYQKCRICRFVTISLFSGLFFFFPLYEISAQPQNYRPAVGLALSGGGSLGMAHVGVLKVMEEAGLRPDYISGVSMGSIVGSMYALGYSADSIHKILKQTRWDDLFSNKIPENKVIFPEKKYFNNNILSFALAPDKIMLPSGLINGQQIENLFSYYLWPAADISDFSRLPVPFMSLATDIITCKTVDLRKGYLPDAIRASMAVPSIFTPLKIDTAFLIDGGVLRNIAITQVKDMGSDIIIGSYVGFHMFDVNELQSATGILKQIAFMNSVSDYSREKQFIDILIEPKLKEFSSTIFSNVDSIVERGYKAALPFRERFRNLADSLNRIAPQKPLMNILNKQTYAFDRIDIIGNEINSDEQVIGVVDIKPGEMVDKILLNERMELLYGRAWFEKVKYRIVPSNDSLILVIECSEKPKAMLYSSVHYDNYLRSGIMISLAAKNLLAGRSSFNIDTYIGQFYRYNINLTQFVSRNQRFGLSANIYADNTSMPLLTIRNETGRFFRRNNSYELSLNRTVGLNNMTRLASSIENVTLVPDFITSDKVKKLAYNYLQFSFTSQINTLDTKHFPGRGGNSMLSLSTSKLLSGVVATDFFKRKYREDLPDDFLFSRAYTLSGNMKHYFSTSRKTTFSIGWNALLTFDSDSVRSPNNYYFAGGPEPITGKSIRMTGFYANEIAVEKFAGFSFDADFELFENIHLTLMTDIAAAQEAAKEKSLSLFGGYGVSIGYLSIIGPVKIGLMQGLSNREMNSGGIKGFLSIGYSF